MAARDPRNREVHVHVHEDEPPVDPYAAPPVEPDPYIREERAAASFFGAQLLWILLIAALIIIFAVLFTRGTLG